MFCKPAPTGNGRDQAGEGSIGGNRSFEEDEAGVEDEEVEGAAWEVEA